MTQFTLYLVYSRFRDSTDQIRESFYGHHGNVTYILSDQMRNKHRKLGSGVFDVLHCIHHDKRYNVKIITRARRKTLDALGSVRIIQQLNSVVVVYRGNIVRGMTYKADGSLGPTDWLENIKGTRRRLFLNSDAANNLIFGKYCTAVYACYRKFINQEK